MRARKTWREKLADSKDLPHVVDMPERMKRHWGGGTLVINCLIADPSVVR